MFHAVAVAILLAGAGREPEEEPPRLWAGGEPAEVPLLRIRDDLWSFGITLGAQGRAVFPLGALDDGFIRISGTSALIDEHLTYLDLFDPGAGVTLEADFLFHPWYPPDTPPLVRQPSMGPYAAFEYDRFGAHRAVDDAGTSITPEALELTSFFAGFKARGIVQDNFSGDMRLGLGLVRYPSVEADFRLPGQPVRRGELFGKSRGFAAEFRMHFGWQFGPFAFVFGFGSRVMEGPDAGTEAALDPGLLWTLEGELGVELRF